LKSYSFISGRFSKTNSFHSFWFCFKNWPNTRCVASYAWSVNHWC